MIPARTLRKLRRGRRYRVLLVCLVGLANSACGPATHLPPSNLPEPPGVDLQLPNGPESLRFAVIGDSGTGGPSQYEIGGLMAAYHQEYPFELVLMLGDNLYGGEGPADYRLKFELPYATLLERDVKFYASLGNHDERTQRFYEHFNMEGELYYSFDVSEHDVRFVALYSDYLDPPQLEWIEQELSGSDELWKIVFFHHPIYSSGGYHGPDEALREALEPLFLEHGVDVVFTGHEHFYERVEPQGGIVYFINGAAAKLREGDIRPTGRTAAGFDEQHSFLLLELDGEELHFQAVARDGSTVDRGTIRPREAGSGSSETAAQ